MNTMEAINEGPETLRDFISAKMISRGCNGLTVKAKSVGIVIDILLENSGKIDDLLTEESVAFRKQLDQREKDVADRERSVSVRESALEKGIELLEGDKKKFDEEKQQFEDGIYEKLHGSDAKDNYLLYKMYLRDAQQYPWKLVEASVGAYKILARSTSGYEEDGNGTD